MVEDQRQPSLVAAHRDIEVPPVGELDPASLHFDILALNRRSEGCRALPRFSAGSLVELGVVHRLLKHRGDPTPAVFGGTRRILR